MSIIAGIDLSCIKDVRALKPGGFGIGVLHRVTFVSIAIAIDDLDAAKQRALDHMRIGLVHAGRKAATNQDLLTA